MTCLTPAEAGQDVRSQNTLGSREIDLLRMTDWFFPEGMNHHELFAGVPGVQSAMQVFARRVAGLGHLPDAATPTKPAARRDVDVLVVGAGPSGMAAALAASRRGHDVLVVDDGLDAGGGARGLTAEDDAALPAILGEFESAARKRKLTFRPRTVAAGVFGRDVVVVGREIEVLVPQSLILASGAHDGVVPFENNDLPGVLSARAACLIQARGITLGQELVVLSPLSDRSQGLARGDALPGLSFADVFARRTRGSVHITTVSEVVRAKGSSHLRSVVVKEGANERTLPADALLVDAPRAPSYELCEQAGAEVRYNPNGFAPVTTRGRAAEGTWAIGEVTGAPLSGEGFLKAAEELAEQLDRPSGGRHDSR
jgi:sarcosine oxidase subunit alpha